MLANLALDGMERLLRQTFCPNPRLSNQNQVHLIRYADDFVITAGSKELLETQVKPLVAQFLAQRGLELSLEKTRITRIEEGFDFLGQNVRKYDGKLLITPSKANVASFLANVREVVKANRSATAGHLVLQLNPKIKGWALYHRHICAKRTFAQVDNALFQALWHWAVRRHPNKGKRWIAQRYFTTLAGEGGGNRWVFFGEVECSDGSSRRVALQQASGVRIRRHIKLRADVNPYSPAWAEYLKQRHSQEKHRSTPARGSG